MKTIIKNVRTGKTCWAIRESSKTGYYIVNKTKQECTYTHKMAREILTEKEFANVPFPLSFREFVSGEYNGKGVKGVIVDDVDILVQYISKVKVHGITLTPEDELTKELRQDIAVVREKNRTDAKTLKKLNELMDGAELFQMQDTMNALQVAIEAIEERMYR